MKIRLGRLTRGGQKGVDSRIVRDLIILSQERAISVAYLLGGDEDLREGVSEAQERGVRVVLLAIEPLARQNLSRTLAMEVDDVIVLDDKIGLVEPVSEAASAGIAGVSPGELGRRFAGGWLESATAAEVLEVRRARPRIPPRIDRLLLEYVVEGLGKSHLEEGDRAALRSGFWNAMERSAEAPPDPS